MAKAVSTLPAATHIGAVHVQVSGLQPALAFYRDLLGFKEIVTSGDSAVLSATGTPPAHIQLSARAGAGQKPPGTAGLYHVAIRFPNRRELARVFRRLIQKRWPFQGFSDHGVSEALYLPDPDGNGIELYTDRPRHQWAWQNHQVQMVTEPLDVEKLLNEASEDDAADFSVHPQTDIGHVHLQVADLRQAEHFYHELLGLDVTQRSYPGALFFSAGGYHHHLGTNIWAGTGAPPPPPEAVGLISFEVIVPDQLTVDAIKARFLDAGIHPRKQAADADGAGGFTVRDFDGNLVALVAKRE